MCFQAILSMKKSAQRVQDFQELPAYNEIPELLWLSIRDAPAATVYPQHAHAWGEFIYAFDGVLEVILIRYIISLHHRMGFGYRHILNIVV